MRRNEPTHFIQSCSQLWAYVKTQKKAPSDKYSAFIMLLFLFTPQIRSEHLLPGVLSWLNFKICTEFRMLAVGGREELPK